MQRRRELHRGVNVDAVSEQSRMCVEHGLRHDVYREEHYRLCPRLQVPKRIMHTVDGSLRQRSMSRRNGRAVLRHFWSFRGDLRVHMPAAGHDVRNRKHHHLQQPSRLPQSSDLLSPVDQSLRERVESHLRRRRTLRTCPQRVEF